MRWRWGVGAEKGNHLLIFSKDVYSGAGEGVPGPTNGHDGCPKLSSPSSLELGGKAQDKGSPIRKVDRCR